jgi:phosphoglycerate dehydrogenase-like enzyme
MTDPTVGVLRRPTHGMPIETYAAALRERLPDHEVRLAHTPADERTLVRDCEVVTGMELADGLLDHAGAMRWFACAYAGVGHLPLDDLRERGVAVTNASGVHGPNVAEHVLGAILSFVRGFGEARRRQDRREWRHFQADELRGSTVTVVGLGAIGTAVLERLEGFGVETIGARYTPQKGGPADEVVGFTDEDALHDALARTDHLVLACPLTEETRGLIGGAEFTTLPPDATLVNVARGPVVDTDALVAALRGEKIGAAALDVTDPEPLPEDHPLWNFGNVLVTPHNAGHTPEYYERLADVVASNVEQVAETGEYEGLANQVEL